jgi:hypothetical protein
MCEAEFHIITDCAITFHLSISSVSHGLSALCVLGMVNVVEKCWSELFDRQKSLEILRGGRLWR